MYSLVMMSALAATPGTLEFNGYFRDLFLGNGCSGTCAGCNGTAYASCSGCNCGGGLFSGDRVRALFSFGHHNCNCNGCTCQGCNATQYASCTGSYAMSCSGMSMNYGAPVHDYYGSCYGGTMMPGMPGMPYGGDTMMPSTTGPMLIPPTSLPMTPGVTPYAQPEPAQYTPRNQLPPPGNASGSASRATVVVKLPADARLIAEGKPLTLTGTERTFVSPELPRGQEFTYTFKIEYDRNGRTLTEQQSVKVTTGKVSTLEFADLIAKTEANPVPTVMPAMPKAESHPALKTAANATSLPKSDAATERARILVKLPAGATLYINDTKQTAGDFKTPSLPRGQEFQYTMKIEIVRNGYPESVTQQVKIRAGDSTTVDFTGGTENRTVSR